MRDNHTFVRLDDKPDPKGLLHVLAEEERHSYLLGVKGENGGTYNSLNISDFEGAYEFLEKYVE